MAKTLTIEQQELEAQQEEFDQEFDDSIPNSEYEAPDLSNRKGDMVFGGIKPRNTDRKGNTTAWKHTKKELLHAFQLSLLGCSNSQLGEFFRVPKHTIENWKKNKPEFAEACRRGKEHASMKVATALLKRAVGYDYEEVKTMEGTNSKGDPIHYEIRTTRHVPPDTKAIIFYLTNRERGLWTNVQKLEIGGSENVGRTIDLDKLSPEEQALARKLALGQIASTSGTSNT